MTKKETFTWYILNPPLEHTQLQLPEGHTLTPSPSPVYEVAEKFIFNNHFKLFCDLGKKKEPTVNRT